MRKVILLQHTTDGYHGEKETFQQEDRLVCPKCNLDLGEVNDPTTYDPTLKEIGFTYECIKSGHKFEKPYVLHFCPDCGSIFDYKTARYVAVFAYSLTHQAVKLLAEDTGIEEKLEPLYAFMKSMRFEVSYKVQMVGVSGSARNLSKVYNIPVLRIQEEGWEKTISSLVSKSKNIEKKNLTLRGLWGDKRE